MKKLFTLIALCLGISSGAWAEEIEWETVWSADFSSAPSGMTYSVSSGNTALNAGGYLEYNQGGGSGNRAINTAFTATAFNVDTNWKMEFDIAFSSSNQNPSNVTFATDQGNVFTCTWEKYATAVVVTDASSSELTNTIPLEGYNRTTMSAKSHVTLTGVPGEGVYLTIKQGSTTYVNNVLATSTFGYPKTLNGSLGRAVSHMMLDNIVFQTPKVAGFVAAPTYQIIGVNNDSRILTLATITDGANMKWSETEPAVGEDFSTWTAYNGTSLTTAATTIYAVAINGSNTSDVTTIATGAGTTIQLVAPTVSVVLNDGIPTYSFASNNSGILGTPSATLTATLNGNPIVLDGNSVIPSENGTLIVTASAAGYAPASTTFKVAKKFLPLWTSTDYSTLTTDNATITLGENWLLSSGGRWASWNAGNEPYIYFGDGSTGNITVEEHLRMRGVISLVLGYGLGRNVSGGEAITMNDMQEGYIASYKMYNGYGSQAASTANYTTYAYASGTSTSVNTNNGALLMQATMYAPASLFGTTVSITPAIGYATFYDSEHAVNIPDDVTPYIFSEDLTLMKYEDALQQFKHLTYNGVIPAGEPVVLKGNADVELTYNATCDLPLLTDYNFLCGKDVETTTTGWQGFPICYYYALSLNSSNDPNSVGFYFMEEDGAAFTTAAHKAYLALPYYIHDPNTPAPSRFLFNEGEATVIKTVNTTANRSMMFNLAGQRVNANAKGIVVVNGKKHLAK